MMDALPDECPECGSTELNYVQTFQVKRWGRRVHDKIREDIVSRVAEKPSAATLVMCETDGCEFVDRVPPRLWWAERPVLRARGQAS